MAMIYGEEGPGWLEILERVPGRGRVTVGWEFCLYDGDRDEVISKPFWFTDPSGTRHVWVLKFSPGFYGTHGARRCKVYDTMAIEHCGYAETGNATFVIQFRITGDNGGEGDKPCEYYSDQTKHERMPHDFSRESTYDIDIASMPIDKGDRFTIKVYCTIIDASRDDIEIK